MNDLRIIVCGSRNWTDKKMIYQTLKTIKDNIGSFTVIEGECPTFINADKLARIVAKNDLNLPVDPTPAEWKRFGKAAGPIRNSLMLKEKRADATIAFHDKIHESSGTKNMVEMSLNAGKPVWVSSEGPIKLAEFIIKLRRILKNKL